MVVPCIRWLTAPAYQRPRVHPVASDRAQGAVSDGGGPDPDPGGVRAAMMGVMTSVLLERRHAPPSPEP